MPSSCGSRLGRLLQKECLAAVEALAAAQDVHVRVHEARKAIRRARSLLALVGLDLDVEAGDAALKRVADGLGELRDAHAAALTAARLGKRLADPRWTQAAAALAGRADRLARRELAADPGFAKRRRAIRRAARQLESLPWNGLRSPGIRKALLLQAKKADKATRRAEKAPGPENLHRRRRRLRRLRMQLDALAALKIRIIGRGPAVSKQLHRQVDELGWRQDLVVLADALRRMRTLDGRRELLEQLENDAIQAPPQ
jgi:CHAD domain-containing protein